MRGRIVVTRGHQGWGNRKSGCEAYGPAGRWASSVELPNRMDAHIAHGDLLGDHLDELGCGEGSPFLVVASTSRFDSADIDRLARLLTPEVIAALPALLRVVYDLWDHGGCDLSPVLLLPDDDMRRLGEALGGGS